jgi:uncharacterized protein
MTLSLHRLATETFIPMLESLSGVLDKGAALADAQGLDLVNARLAPDMFPLKKQVNIACFFVMNAMARLSGQPALTQGEPRASFAEFKAQIAEAVGVVRSTPSAALEGADLRDCTMELQSGMKLPMDGTQFMLAWALPNFYFHVVTAYDILRHHGVEIGKRDYMSGLAALMRPS